MALTRALAATGEKITNTERTVTSALTLEVQAFLPVAGDGSNGTSAEGATIVFNSTTAAGGITVLDVYGHYITRCPGKGNAAVTVENGQWVPSTALDALAARTVVANGSGATALGSLAPASVATPATTAGWFTTILPDGSLGYTPYWK